MRTALSQDGAPIAFDQSGEGLPIILVVGAFNTSATGVPLAAQLSAYFAVFNSDRRGRGESGDTVPSAPLHEVEDLNTLSTVAGGPASAFGCSSGSILTLMAAARGLTITKLACYDPPFLVNAGSARRFKEPVGQLGKLIASDRRGEAVERFQTQALSMPDHVVAQLRQAPSGRRSKPSCIRLSMNRRFWATCRSFPNNCLPSRSRPS